MKPKYGYDINTGEPCHDYEDRMVYIGGGYYKAASEVTEEDVARKAKWNASINLELNTFKLGLEET